MRSSRKRFLLYGTLLKLYPVAYRRRYESEMLQTVADMLADTHSPIERAKVWLKIGTDLMVSVYKEQMITQVGIMRNAPPYIKMNSLISAMLLGPFFGAVIANSVDRILFHKDLYHSWLWSAPLIGLWVLYLPMLSLLIAGGSFAAYVVRPTRGPSITDRFENIRQNGALLIIAFVALGILCILFFHDSVHCWVHSPMFIAAHFKNVWQCSEGNRAGIFTMIHRSLGV